MEIPVSVRIENQGCRSFEKCTVTNSTGNDGDFKI